jgi:hypothetical protein
MMLNSKDEASRATIFFGKCVFLHDKEKGIVVNPIKVFFQGKQ